MMKMENDEFKIPEQYLVMSVVQLEEETERVLEQIKREPRNIQRKKKASKGRKEVMFNF